MGYLIRRINENRPRPRISRRMWY